MKSKFFKQIALSDNGKKHLKALANARPETRAYFTKWLCDLKTSPRMDTTQVKRFAEETGETADAIQDMLSIAWTLVQRIGWLQDSPDTIAADATTAGLLQNDEASRLQDFLAGLGDTPRRLYKLQRKAGATDWGMATLSGSSMCVSIKQVVEKSFEYDEQNIRDYNPQVMAYQVVGQIELVATAAAGVKNTLAFQVNAENLDRFISDLLALQKELQIAESLESKMPTMEQPR